MVLRNTIIAFFLIIQTAVISCGSETQEVHVSSLRTSIVETDDFYEITALGASAAGEGVTEAQAKRHAADVASILAVELLVEVIQGVGISGNVKLRDLNIGEGRLLQLMQARLRGVRPTGKIEYERQSDGSWLAAYTIQYDKINAAELTASLLNEQSVRELLLSSKERIAYTGILFDLRFESGFNILVNPVIAGTDRNVIFTIRKMARKSLDIHAGIPVYSSIRDAVSGEYGIGDRPLKIVPESFDSESGTIVLSPGDTERIRSIPNSEELMSLGKIALII